MVQCDAPCHAPCPSTCHSAKQPLPTYPSTTTTTSSGAVGPRPVVSMQLRASRFGPVCMCSCSRPEVLRIFTFVHHNGLKEHAEGGDMGRAACGAPAMCDFLPRRLTYACTQRGGSSAELTKRLRSLPAGARVRDGGACWVAPVQPPHTIHAAPCPAVQRMALSRPGLAVRW